MTTKTKKQPVRTKETKIKKRTPTPQRTPVHTPHFAPDPAPDQRLRVELAALIESHQSEVAALKQQIAQLTADLATVTAERDQAVQWQRNVLSAIAAGYTVDLSVEARRMFPRPPQPPPRFGGNILFPNTAPPRIPDLRSEPPSASDIISRRADQAAHQ